MTPASRGRLVSSLLASGDLPKGTGTWERSCLGPFRLFDYKWKATGQLRSEEHTSELQSQR